MLTPDKNRGRFITILADGKFHETVPQGTEGAVLREYETSDKKKGEKWELVYSRIEAHITSIAFQDGDYGKQLQVKFKDSEGEVTVSVNTTSNFAEDILKKLPNVDFTKTVAFAPYSFVNDKGKTVRGVNVFQGETKLFDYFRNEKKEYLHGFPEPAGDTREYDSDDWKLWFMQSRKFLEKFTIENVMPKLAVPAVAVEYPTDGFGEGIPF